MEEIKEEGTHKCHMKYLIFWKFVKILRPISSLNSFICPHRDILDYLGFHQRNVSFSKDTPEKMKCYLASLQKPISRWYAIMNVMKRMTCGQRFLSHILFTLSLKRQIRCNWKQTLALVSKLIRKFLFVQFAMDATCAGDKGRSLPIILRWSHQLGSKREIWSPVLTRGYRRDSGIQPRR